MSIATLTQDNVYPLSVTDASNEYCALCGAWARATVNGVRTCSGCIHNGRLIRHLYNRSRR